MRDDVLRVQVVKLASAATRSGGGSGLAAAPIDERAPLIHWMEDFSRAKHSKHLNHGMVLLYVCSRFWAIIEASLL